MNELFNIERLLNFENKESWMTAYEEEMEKLDGSFERLARVQYDILTQNIDSTLEEEIQSQHYKLFSNPQMKTFIEQWEMIEEDTWWKRRCKVLKTKVMEAEIESHPQIVKLKNELQSKLLNHIFQYQGESYPFSTLQVQFMNHSNRELRKNLFEQLNQFSEQVDPTFRKLVKTRNNLAQQKGFKNYYQYVFEGIMGLNFQQYKEQINQLLEDTTSISLDWEKRFQEKFQWSQTQYFDVLYATLHYAQIPEEPFSGEKIREAIEFTCRKLNLELDMLPIQVELMDIPFGGLMTAISPTDLKLVVKKRDGHSGFAVGLHELGHALYEYYSSHQKPDFFRFKSVIGHEAMAEMFMKIASQKEWLTDFIGADESVVNAVQEAEYLFCLTLTKLYYYQSILEQSIYDNPELDFQKLSNQLFEEVFGLPGMAMNPAVDIMFTLYPVYTHTYIYADGIRDMLRFHLDSKGLYKNTELWEKIRKSFMEPSESLTWQEKVRELCGQEFNFEAFGDYLAQRRT